jgi:hypothetical protein
VTLKTAAELAVAVGAFLAIVATARPSWLRFVPGMYWFHNPNVRAGRISAFAVAFACVAWGLTILGVIPKAAQSVVLVLVVFGLFCGLASDIPDDKSD